MNNPVPFQRFLFKAMQISVMQLILAVLFGCLSYAHTIRGQEILQQEISVHMESAELKRILNQIEKKANIKFIYSSHSIQVSQRATLKATKRSLSQVLDELLTPLQVQYEVLDSRILLRKKPVENVSPPTEVTVPDRKLSGNVTDERGERLPGVSILVKGTQQGVISDNDGNFSITVPDENAVLVFSFVGYVSQEIIAGNRSLLDVTLKVDEKALEEVVVVGYGVVRKSDLTGSVAKVGEEEIKAVPVISLDRAMQGRVSGVMVTTSSGAPGASTTIRIRGTGSVNAGNDPLYVIDGFPTSNLNSINPSDIESIEILKDASATAIYGSRGSNGVVLVTTKRGKEDQSNISFEGYYGVQTARRKIPLLNAREYAEFINEARVNAGSTPYFDGSAPERPVPSSLGEGTDWQDEVLRSAPVSSYQLNFSGGEKKTRYAISGNYFNQQGILLNSYFKRYTLRANLDRDVRSWLKLGLSMQGAYTHSNSSFTPAQGGSGGGVINAALNYAPVFSVRDGSGNYYRDFSALNGNLVDNPVGLARERTDLYTTFRLLSNLFAEIKLMDGLIFRTSLGTDLFNSKSNYYATRLIGLGDGSNGVAAVSASQNINWLNENTLTYTRTIRDRHNLSVLLGYTSQAYHNESVTANAANFTNDFALFNNLGSGATLRAPSSGASDWALISYIARVNYGWDNRYLVTLTTRADGSSRFGPNNKYGIFPSGAFAWRIINEKFMGTPTWLSDLKFRASYGITGNQSIGDYQYLSSISNSTAVLGGILQAGNMPSGISNLDLSWEKNHQFDVGFDFAFLNNRLQITTDYYIKTTSDLLFSVNVPQTTGYSSSLRNIGKVENRGWEFSLKSVNLDQRPFQWTSEFNIAFNKNKVLTLDGRPEFLSGSGIGHLQISNTVLLRVGESLGNFYGRQVEGIFQNQQEIDASAQKTAKPGDFKYKDLNGDDVINDSDRTIIGNGYPVFFGGLNNTFSYKGFDLNIFFQGSFGNDILNYGRFDLYSLNGNGNQAKEVLNRWTPTNPSNEIPRANAAGGRILSSFHIEKASYLRLRNISLNYTLPAALVAPAAIKNIRLYLSAQNWLTFTKYKGFDPEVSRFESSSISQGMDFSGYPTTKSFTVGLNANF